METATIVGTSETVSVAVSERVPSQQSASAGQTGQRVQLLLLSGGRLDPPVRLLLRGGELRVLGTQAPPAPGLPSLVLCERVLPDLPDSIVILSVGERTLSDTTKLLTATETQLWAGMGHVSSGIPETVDAGNVPEAVDKITLTTPLDAPYAKGLRVRVSVSRTPGIAGADWVMAGEVLDSSASLRRVICYRYGG